MMINIRLLDVPSDLVEVEKLQQKVWSSKDIEVVPVHMLLAAIHGGGLLIGAYDSDMLVGFVFGFPGYENTDDGFRLFHCSHMAGVHPDYQNQGLGFKLKRAQWQMVRKQGVDRITWTYDPLLSKNAKLNISKLGAVCNTYYPNYYGELRDQLNLGMPTDRLRVDWWLNSRRVNRRLSKTPPKRLDLAHYLSAETIRLNETRINHAGLITPHSSNVMISSQPLFLFEIPVDFQMIKSVDPALALEWRIHTRSIFQDAFKAGYLVTDFVFLPGSRPRSYYVLSYGERTL